MHSGEAVANKTNLLNEMLACDHLVEDSASNTRETQTCHGKLRAMFEIQGRLFLVLGRAVFTQNNLRFQYLIGHSPSQYVMAEHLVLGTPFTPLIHIVKLHP